MEKLQRGFHWEFDKMPKLSSGISCVLQLCPWKVGLHLIYPGRYPERESITLNKQQLNSLFQDQFEFQASLPALSVYHSVTARSLLRDPPVFFSQLRAVEARKSAERWMRWG